MRVREATLADAAAMARVHVDSWRTTYRGIMPDEHLAGLSYDGRARFWRQVLSGTDSPGFHCVAEDEDGQIVGIASGGPERSGDPDYAGELYGIYLLQSHQRKGIGSRLFCTVVERLAESGIYSMLVWVLAANRSRRFYESLGGKRVREKQIERGGVRLEEVAYGWTDTRAAFGERLDVGIRPRRWTREEYYRAAELGLFDPDERLELLDGEIWEQKRPQTPQHATVLLVTAERLADAFGPGHHVRPQFPLILNMWSEPAPDVLVVTGSPDSYAESHPNASDTRLLVEVSDTTLRFDQGRKQVLYARAGIAEYWIVNLPQRQLEVYRDPSGSRYQSVTIHDEQEVVTPPAAPHASIRVADLLPPAPARENG